MTRWNDALGGERRVYGVASAVFPSADASCAGGAVYGLLGPRTREFLAQAIAYQDPCENETVKGRCAGGVAIRCTGKGEGDRALSRVDCSAVGLTCGTGATGRVACIGGDT